MINHLSVFMRHPAARATGLVFASMGLVFGSWAALIPYVKQKYGLDEAQLGLLLLALPAGVTLMNPLSVPLLNRFGAAVTSQVSLVLSALLFILPFAVPYLWLTVVGLFLAGAAFSCTNVSMNTCASLLEQRAGLRIISTCHGLWSTGAMIGSALASAVTGWGLQPTAYLALLAFCEITIMLWIRRPLAGVPDDLPASNDAKAVGKSAGFVWPNKPLWLLIGISLCVNLAEGTMADWSAVYMREVVEVPGAMAGWGFAVYAFFMAGGRFLGDELIGRFSSRVVLRAGGWVVMAGLLAAVVLPGAGAVLAGFALVGMGVSLGAPILYAAAARAPGMAKGAGLATMNTFAMIGFLGGPAFIGFLAKWVSLPAAFAVVAAFAGVWAFQAGRMKGEQRAESGIIF